MTPSPGGGRRFLFVGGKGGVGKTTVAGALGLRAAEAGNRVLLVSTDPAHSLGDLFDRRIGDRPVEILPRLHALEIDPEAEVDRYLGRVAESMRSFVNPEMYPEIRRQMELARHGPGAAEAALMDRLAGVMEDEAGAYDRLIFDTAPTGHTLRLLALPEIMAAWTEGLLRSRERSEALGEAERRLSGPGKGDELSLLDEAGEPAGDRRSRRIRAVLLERRRKFYAARRLLLDREATAFILVLVPEKLPILETGKALDALRAHDVPVWGLVVNRVLPAEPLGEFLEQRREQEAAYLARIDRAFEGLPQVRVPLLARDVEGLEALREVAGYLG